MTPPTETTPGGSPPEEIKIIDKPTLIQELLEKALLGEENVEIQISQRTRVFFTQLLDHLPELMEIPKPSGEITYRDPPYPVCAYLKERDHLLIAPMEPSIGNAHIRSCEGLTLRFFQGVNAIEGEVAFQKVLAVRGEPAIQIGYPTQFKVYRKRRHFRADVTMGMEVRVVLSRPGVHKETRLFDISAGGASVQIGPDEVVKFPTGEAVTVTIAPQGEAPEFEVKGFIRNHMDAPVAVGKRRREKRFLCGVQFDLMDNRTAMRIDELVAGIQREKLKRIMARTRANRPELTAPEETPNPEVKSRSGIQQELTRFFAHKKEFFSR